MKLGKLTSRNSIPKWTEYVSWGMMGFGILGFLVSFPLWLFGIINEKAMLGVTLVLSWAALWYSAFIAIIETRREQ